jgi:hypothetical protein
MGRNVEMGLKPISTASFSPVFVFFFFISIKCCNIAVENYKYEIQLYTSSSSPVKSGQMQYVYMKINSGFAILQTLFFYIY